MTEQGDLLQAAEERYTDARYLLDGGRYSAAVSSSYCAAFNAAKALLLERDSSSRTRQGVSSELGRLFREELEPEVTRRYSDLQTQRERADYEPGRAFGEEEGRRAVEFSEEFISRRRDIIREANENRNNPDTLIILRWTVDNSP